MNTIKMPFIPQPKPKHKRIKPTRKERGRVTQETYEFVTQRDNYTCVRCGKNASYKDKHGFFLKMEVAHAENKSQGGWGKANNLAVLCGPSVNSDTCHHWVDYTKEGKEWFKEWGRTHLDENGNYKE